jgi:hypothetical protein
LVKQNSRESETDEIDESHAQDIYRSNNIINIEATGSTSSSASLLNCSQALDRVAGKTAQGSHDEKVPALTRTNKFLGRAASSPSLSVYSIDYTSAGTFDPFYTYQLRFLSKLINYV